MTRAKPPPPPSEGKEVDCICPVQMYPSAEASLAGGSGRLAGWGAWMIGTAVEKGIPRRSGVGFTSGIRPEG